MFMILTDQGISDPLGQCVMLFGSIGCTIQCPRGSQLDSALGNVMTNQSLHHPGTDYILWPPEATCDQDSLHHSGLVDFIPVPNSCQGAFRVKVRVTFREHASSNRH